ncbi:MAG: hypothetical protein AAF664_22830 [Planctomycetota bacterium]
MKTHTIFLLLAITSLAGQCAVSADETNHWKADKLKELTDQIQSSVDAEQINEFKARQAWLRRWEPGRMPTSNTTTIGPKDLKAEPLLSELTCPVSIKPKVWEYLVALQRQLIEIDTAENRKQELERIIEVSAELQENLVSHLPRELQEGNGSLSWCLAFARYRLGRSLAYRELPKVRQRWPISNPEQYESRLVTAYRQLVDHMGSGRPEFILLEDRMLRRSGQKGLALEMLETNRSVIDKKWYLKKRRDLLEELDWASPYQEASKIYRDAGYVDDP